MGKATRVKRENARERIAAQRAAQHKREMRNRMLWTGGSILGVIVIVVAFIVIKTTQSPASANSADSSSPAGTALPAGVVKDVTSVPSSTLASVATGTADPKSVTTVSSAAPLTSGGSRRGALHWRPVLPVLRDRAVGPRLGAEQVRHLQRPERHPLGRQPRCTRPATLNFYKASYASKYLTFTPVEQETVAEKPLEKLTSAQTALITKYDSPPYVSASEQGAIPFIDFGGKYFVHGAQYDPQVLSGQSWAQVAAALQDPSSAIAKGADGAANMITATICKTTNNQPANVCTTPTIKTIEGQI